MILIIPSIEISESRCRFRIIGNSDAEKYYEKLESNPFDLCKLFRLENVKSIHILDSDSFVNPNLNNYSMISRMTLSTFLPFQVNANYETYEECKNLLEYGVHRLIISDIAVRSPEIIKKLIAEYTGHRIVFSLPVINRSVFFKHIDKSYNLNYYISHIKELGATRVVYHEYTKTLNEMIDDSEKLNILKNNFDKWTLEYDVSGYHELTEVEGLTTFGVDSVIIGKPFYETVFPCQNIWRIAESRLDN